MDLYAERASWKLYHGDMLEMLDIIEPNTIDSIVTDPPYEFKFMSKKWDKSGVSFDVKTWEKCYEVLKPGGYLLAFGGNRTFHKIITAIEKAGFEIRDTIMWLYGCGFPKSMNIGLAIDKKNGVESKSIGMSSKTTRDFSDVGKKQKEISDYNGLSFGQVKNAKRKFLEIREAQNKWRGWGTCLKPSFEPITVARKPFKGSLLDNIAKNGVGGLNIDECRVKEQRRFPANTVFSYDENINKKTYLRYFYCAKASGKDRDEGLFNFEEKTSGELTNRQENSAGITAFAGSRVPKRNFHPTVKPTELMQYLVRLVTPNGGTILDPFNGSGSTGKAVMYENKERDKGYKYIGIELESEYLDISKARIEFAENDKKQSERTT